MQLISTLGICLVAVAVVFRTEAREPDPVFFLQTVDPVGNTGYSPEIDIDRDGLPHIGYVDLTRVRSVTPIERRLAGAPRMCDGGGIMQGARSH